MDDRRGHAACDHQQHADERRAGEARNHQAEHVDARAGRRAHTQDHEPEEAAEPDGGGGDVRPVEHERERRGRRLRRVPGQAGDGRRRPGGQKRAGQGEERGHRPLPATAVVDPEERPGREAEQHEHDLEVGERPAQVGVADDRHRGGEVEERALGELRRRDEDVEGDRNQRHGERDRRRQRDARSGTPAIAAAGRAMTARSENRPTAIIMLRKTSQRVTISCGVAADSESDGMTNCGAGPGLGPTAKVNAPRTGWPSAEITRQ